MKRRSKSLLLIILITLCSSTTSIPALLNANSWSIRIGKRELLASWKNNQMGDTATIDKKKIKATDTLLVQRYLCGYSCQSCVTRVTIQNERDEVIAESKNEGNSFTFTGKIPVSDIIHSKAFNNSQVLAVYFTIKDKAENMDQTVLLGRLRFR